MALGRRVIAYDKRAQLFAVCLSSVAGFVDALAFQHLGGFFASFMSGNSTKLAVGLVFDLDQARTAGWLIGTFLVGVMLGAAAARLAAPRSSHAALLLMATLLVCAAALHETGWDTPAVVAMVLAMGAENAIFQRNGDVAIGLTYMTGTLVKSGQRLTAALFGDDPWAWLPYALLWCGLLLGAVAGAMAYSLTKLDGLWVAAGTATLLFGLAAVHPPVLGGTATSEPRNRELLDAPALYPARRTGRGRNGGSSG